MLQTTIKKTDDVVKIVTIPGITREISDEAKPDQAELHFRSLGHHRGQFFFITARGKQVLNFQARNLANKANLFMLAPLQWWEREFPNDKGFTGKAVDQAVNWLLNACYSMGVFHLDRMRGLGAWWDDGRAVIHAGDRLIVDRSQVPIESFESRYVYEALPSLSIDLSDPLPETEAYKLFNFATSLNWEKAEYGTFYAGWVTIAMVCGALPWRPHLFITGPSGSGKTWVTKQMQKLLGQFVLSVTGETSAAGLRQELQHNAMPVLFGEAEGEDRWTEANLDKILGLMRQASSEDEGLIYKGGQDGIASSYTVRSMFCLSAIRNPIKQTADENRICIITLNRSDADGLAHFRKDVEPLAREIFSPKWSSRFRAMVINNLPILRANIEVFAQAAGDFFRNQRIGDQVAPLLAGAYLLHPGSKLITIDQARNWLQVRDWSEQIQIRDESDEEKVLTSLLEAVIRIPMARGNADLSVGELIKAIHMRGVGVDIDSRTAGTTLARHGILVKNDSVIISNTHRAIRHLLRDTGWAVGWGRILKRIDGAAVTVDKKSFAGAQSRGTVVPLRAFFVDSG